MPRRALPHADVGATLQPRRRTFGNEQFCRTEPFQFRRECLVAGRLQGMEPSAREFEPGKAEAIAAGTDRGQQRVAAFLEQRVVGDGAGSDDSPLRTARAR
jgi:hypothetical protein